MALVRYNTDRTVAQATSSTNAGVVAKTTSSTNSAMALRKPAGGGGGGDPPRRPNKPQPRAFAKTSPPKKRQLRTRVIIQEPNRIR
jgi:hypothetical protein